MADRGAVLLILSRALDILDVQRWNDLRSSLPKVLAAGILVYASVQDNALLDLAIKCACYVWTFAELMVKAF